LRKESRSSLERRLSCDSEKGSPLQGQFLQRARHPSALAGSATLGREILRYDPAYFSAHVPPNSCSGQERMHRGSRATIKMPGRLHVVARNAIDAGEHGWLRRGRARRGNTPSSTRGMTRQPSSNQVRAPSKTGPRTLPSGEPAETKRPRSCCSSWPWARPLRGPSRAAQGPQECPSLLFVLETISSEPRKGLSLFLKSEPFLDPAHIFGTICRTSTEMGSQIEPFSDFVEEKRPKSKKDLYLRAQSLPKTDHAIRICQRLVQILGTWLARRHGLTVDMCAKMSHTFSPQPPTSLWEWGPHLFLAISKRLRSLRFVQAENSVGWLKINLRISNNKL